MTNSIALLTDFGIQDSYVGVMKGVMHGICPQAHFIDITHELAPQNVRQAAFTLLNAYHYFPAGTVFLVVVDPGVGSLRLPIAVKSAGYTFVAPDNGVLTYALAHLGAEIQAVALTNAEYHLNTISRTFHGRDIFSPCAAHLAAGVPFEKMGESLDDIIRLDPPRLTLTERQIVGEIIHIDHFGNCVSSIGQFRWRSDNRLLLASSWSDEVVQVSTKSATIKIGEQTFPKISRTYSDVEKGDGLVLIGSEGYLEIATNHGNAADRYQIQLGDEIMLTLG
ncbi:MAG: SAM-dependent chlorinase/fluorinase [Aggregatilineales bacterium]